eukprot:jgi/Hompol1/2801/HPOL_006167-RA
MDRQQRKRAGSSTIGDDGGYGDRPVDSAKNKDKRSIKSKKAKLEGLPEWLAHPLTIAAQIEQTQANQVTATADAPATIPLALPLQQRLAAMGITHWFPVQSAVVPRLLRLPLSLHSSVSPTKQHGMDNYDGDICVSASTGSGKTLAYALPIVATLQTRIIRRVRALVVVPTRELALQVRRVFDDLIVGSSLRVATVTGNMSFSSEQATLVHPQFGSASLNDAAVEIGGSSRIDILIATPGRLLDHLNGTPGFTLRHLRFLVIDEADRLLNQGFHGWLSGVLASVEPPQNASDFTAENAATIDEFGLPLHSLKRAPLLPASTQANDSILLDTVSAPVQKLLFSATLTRNPSKIASLRLRNPIYITITDMDVIDDGEQGNETEQR